jgi:nucleoside 2-deoxyribosyltransferase
MTTLPLIYISGPFSHPDPVHGTQENILKASRVTLECCRAGWATFCPHKNTAGFQHVQDVPYQFWMDMDLEILSRCDAVLLIEGWANSPGASREFKFAQAHGIPFFFARDGIPSAQGIRRTGARS